MQAASLSWCTVVRSLLMTARQACRLAPAQTDQARRNAGTPKSAIFAMHRLMLDCCMCWIAEKQKIGLSGNRRARELALRIPTQILECR